MHHRGRRVQQSAAQLACGLRRAPASRAWEAAKTTSWPWQKAPGKTEKKNGFARWWSMCFPEPSKAAPSLPKPTPKRAQELVKKKSAEKAA